MLAITIAWHYTLLVQILESQQAKILRIPAPCGHWNFISKSEPNNRKQSVSLKYSFIARAPPTYQTALILHQFLRSARMISFMTLGNDDAWIHTCFQYKHQRKKSYTSTDTQYIMCLQHVCMGMSTLQTTCFCVLRQLCLF